MQLKIEEEVAQLDTTALTIPNVAPLVVGRALAKLSEKPNYDNAAQGDESDDKEREQETGESNRR